MLIKTQPLKALKAASRSVGSLWLILGVSAVLVTLSSCASRDEPRPRYELPRYATPGPVSGASMTWEVRCGFNKVVVPDQTFKQFYKEDGTQMTEEEFCATVGNR